MELTVPNRLPEQLLVLSLEVIEKKDALIEEAYFVPVSSVEEMRTADQVAKNIARLFKEVEEQRLKIGRELDAVRAQVKDAAAEALAPLKEAWDALAKRIRAFEDAENARREKLRREAEAEAARLQAEEEERARKAADEAKARAELETPPDAPPAPIELTAETLPARIEAAYVPPPIKSSAVRSKGGKVLKIIDESKIPFEVKGLRLWKEPNAALIKQLLAADPNAVPGCALVDPEGYGMAAK